ncbi:MAG: ATP-dependent DNA ligase [Propionibacteriaceae bacterium]|nr:ATP-dependent DNA ligase [Propionibacteriaceae bacterium]
MGAEQVVVDGQRIAVTNTDKVLYPATGTTKGDVIAYYTEIAPVILPHLRQRPITRKRWPDGVGDGESETNVFFAKDLPKGTPDWVRRHPIKHSKGSNNYPVADDTATLVWLAQLASLELHVPQWRFSQGGHALAPDRLVLDLDPGPGVGLADCAEVARWVRDALTDAGMECFPVTSGSKGIHLYAPLDGSLDTEAASQVARELGRALQSAHPDRVTAVMRRADRDGKVFLDWSQNNGSKTTISPYSLRGRSHPWVAAPRTWDELADPDLRQLDFHEVLDRVREHGDLFAALLPPATAGDRLSTYRSMRDATLTPEPVPAHAPPPTEGNSFVVQEHHARRLHWDFRLERDGVLVSWAVPKGPPDNPKRNNLAVHVEDHPLDYGGFEGTIPKGQYGAGTVTIWDAGTYECEKWREGKEVIVTLHGRPDGGLGGVPAKFALIHTGEENWLIHRMELAPPASQPVAATSQRLPPLPETITPMLATLATASANLNEADWSFEMKWDGVRALCHLDHGTVRIVGRRGRDETERYPDLIADLAALPADTAILDGEIVVLDAAGAPRFELLQPRINLSRPGDITAAAAKAPAVLMLFDLLALNGASLLKLGYEQRRELLEHLADGTHGRLQVPPAFDGDLIAALDASDDLRLEGVVAKRRGSPYRPGQRNDDWLKIKHRQTQSVVVGGWRPGEGRRAGGLGALLLGIPGADGLDYVGRVGSGFNDAGLVEAERLLEPLASDASPFVQVPSIDAKGAHWLRPELVGEVFFTERTSSGHLRHPVWIGWRPDLAPADVRIEQPRQRGE